MLEQIQNTNVLDEVILTPSYLIKDVWDVQTCDFSHFMKLTLSNLLELEGKDKKEMNQNLQEFINKSLQFKNDSLKRNCKSEWYVTEKNVQSELDRSSGDKVSFYFVLRWLQYEMNQ